MIYTYIALATLGIYALLATAAYAEEKKSHRKTFEQAKKIIAEHHEIMEEMERENTRLACVAKAYRILANYSPEE